jgi:hypothetical protein
VSAVLFHFPSQQITCTNVTETEFLCDFSALSALSRSTASQKKESFGLFFAGYLWVDADITQVRFYLFGDVINWSVCIDPANFTKF